VTRRRDNLPAIVLFVALAAMARPAAGQTDHVSDSERKALFLSNFLQFVHWPAGAFQDSTDSLRVQIIGRDPFDGSLDRVLADKTLDHRRVVVTHTAVPSITPFPHVAVISATEVPRLASLLASYCRAPVLTVSDLDRFANRGGMIGLVEGGVAGLIEDDHGVHFVINRMAANEAHLQVDAEILHLAYPLFSAVSPCGAR